MNDSKQTKSTKAGSREDSNSKSSCCNFENMAQMMKKFCVGKEGSFDFCAMMEKMCRTDREEPDHQ